MSRNWNAHDVHGFIAIGEGSYTAREVVLLDPTCKTSYRHAYVLWFGAVGTTYLHVYASGLEDALEQCAEWLAEYAPGHITSQEGFTDLLKEACEDAEASFDDLFCHGASDLTPEADEIYQTAEADLTYTESGYLTSYEWGISLENPSTDDLYTFIHGT